VWSSNDRLAFVTRRDRRTHVIVDGRDFAFDLAFEDSLAFSSDGRHWAIVAGELAREQLFFAVDGTRRQPLAQRGIYSAAAREPMLSSQGDLLRTWARKQAERAAVLAR
jgi:hypothetical protein